MRAIEKINALGVPLLHRKTGRPPSIIYRWRKALENGRGISDRNKRQLIEASKDTDHVLDWPDFLPTPADA